MKTKHYIILGIILFIIMQLTDLGLNRYLYKDNATTNVDSSLLALNNVNDPYSSVAGGGAGSTEADKPAKFIASGTIIQTSPSQNRIEMNPDDTFKVYRNGEVVFEIDQGNFSTIIPFFGDIITADTIDTNHFSRNGIEQPTQVVGNVSALGVLSDLSAGATGWSVIHLATGVYEIDYTVVPTPPGIMYMLVNTQIAPNIISAVQTGPGVIIVTAFDPATETAIDVDFNFSASYFT